MKMKNSAPSLPVIRMLDQRDYLSCGLVTLVLILAAWPLLARSPWIDEVVLFTNFPLNPFRAFLFPLPYFDQAATPLYSAVWSLLGSMSPFCVRLLSLSTLLFASIYLVGHSIERRFSSAILVAAASILAYKPSFVMLSEMKHYGLEIFACLCIVSWVIRKDPSESLNRRDLIILFCALLLGISTFPLGVIALGLFFAYRIWKVGFVTRGELILSAIYLSTSGIYYLLVKRIVFFQISNYPDAYRYEGVFVSIKQYVFSLVGLLPGGSINAVFIFAFIPIFIAFLHSLESDSTRRLLVFSVATFLVYLVLSALGVYPAKYPRHVIWFSAILWVLFAVSLSLVIDWVRHYSRNSFVSYIPLLVFLVISLAPLLRSASFASSDLSGTHNNEAISQLKTIPASKLRFWIGGEAVFHYYLRHDPALSKFSVRDWSPKPSALITYDDRDGYDRTKIDMLPAARESFRDIQPGERFLIFASHFDRQGGSARNRSKGLHDALAERMCEFSTKDYSRVSIYDVICGK